MAVADRPIVKETWKGTEGIDVKRYGKLTCVECLVSAAATARRLRPDHLQYGAGIAVEADDLRPPA